MYDCWAARARPAASLSVLPPPCSDAASAGAADVVPRDASPKMLGRVRGAARVCASMVRLPFAAGVFDAVISGLAIGHAADLGAWMVEVARVLKSGGRCLYM